ncbi:MAG: phosphate signaling complex protein PhoU, partial [Deltaproteobacteria bacterium]|nr:phosphate signaling complex protein PhoU [Deltaproteobacteria bacterium]
MSSLSSLHKDIGTLRDDLLNMGGLVEEAVDGAVRALKNRDAQLAERVISGDSRIDKMENMIDEDCLKLLATQQPVAQDLRFITSVLRISGYLERIADQAVNLAQRAQIIAGLDPIEIPLTVLEMAAEAQEMIAGSLNAFVQEEIDLARAVCRRDDIVDQLNHSLLEEMISVMMNERRMTRSGLEIIPAGRHLERMGDGATNISEAVVFMVQGTIIRHQPD